MSSLHSLPSSSSSRFELTTRTVKKTSRPKADKPEAVDSFETMLANQIRAARTAKPVARPDADELDLYADGFELPLADAEVKPSAMQPAKSGWPRLKQSLCLLASVLARILERLARVLSLIEKVVDTIATVVGQIADILSSFKSIRSKVTRPGDFNDFSKI